MTTFFMGAVQKPPPPPAAIANGVAILSGEKWLQTVTALHKRVRAEMPDSKRAFLLPRTPDFFRSLLTGKAGVLFGLFAGAELVGSMALLWADSFSGAREEGLITYPDADGRLAKKYRKGSVAVVQAMGLLNAYMGRGGSRALVQKALECARSHGCAHVFAQIAAQNTLSWLRFLDRGFAIAATWTSGHPRFLLRWLSPEDKAKLLRNSATIERHVYGNNYAQMPALLTELKARLGQGKLAFLDDRQDGGGLPFVFSR
jgi:hypothetical protein